MSKKKKRPRRAWLTERSQDLLEQADRKLPVDAKTSQVVESALERYVDDLDE